MTRLHWHIIYIIYTLFLQGDNHSARSEGVPGSAVVGGVEIRLHDIVDGEGGEDGSALGRRFALFHSVPLHQGPLLLLPHILLPSPNLEHTQNTCEDEDDVVYSLYDCICSDMLIPRARGA